MEDYLEIKKINGVMNDIVGSLFFLFVVGSIPFISVSAATTSWQNFEDLYVLFFTSMVYFVSIVGSAEASRKVCKSYLSKTKRISYR